MNVGITTFGCDAGRSGISQYTINLLREFAKLDTAITWEILTHVSEDSVFSQESGRIGTYNIADFWRSPLLNIAWHQTGLPHVCHARQYDVLFLPAGNRRLPCRLPCPSVGTVHDFSGVHVQGKYDPLRMYYIRHVLPALMARLTRVITISESSKEDILAYTQVRPERVTVIPLAVDHHRYHSQISEEDIMRVATRYNIPGPYILYVSRIEHPGKNHVQLIQAFEELKRTEHIPHSLVLAGSDWRQADIVHEKAAASSVAGDIIFTGFVDNNDLPPLYHGADLFVFPSLYEGFGLPILEAMACGTPVACSNVSSMPEVAGDAAPQFNPSDCDQIVAVMKTLVLDSDARQDYIARGYSQSARFHWETTARKTVDILREACEDR